MNIAVHIPFHRWEVTRGGRWAGRMMGNPDWWERRAPIFRDWTLRSLDAQTDQDFEIVASFRDIDYSQDNPVVRVCADEHRLSIHYLVRPYEPWQYHIAPNQASSFCTFFGGSDEWLAILTMDSDDCYEQTVVDRIRRTEPENGLCCWFPYGYLYGIEDGKMATFGSRVGPPPFFCKFYPPDSLKSPEAFNAYRKKWGLNCYHHQTSRRRVNAAMPDNLILQTIHGANATTGWADPHTTKHIKKWVSGDAEKQSILAEFGVDNG